MSYSHPPSSSFLLSSSSSLSSSSLPTSSSSCAATLSTQHNESPCPHESMVAPSFSAHLSSTSTSSSASASSSSSCSSSSSSSCSSLLGPLRSYFLASVPEAATRRPPPPSLPISQQLSTPPPYAYAYGYPPAQSPSPNSRGPTSQTAPPSTYQSSYATAAYPAGNPQTTAPGPYGYAAPYAYPPLPPPAEERSAMSKSMSFFGLALGLGLVSYVGLKFFVYRARRRVPGRDGILSVSETLARYKDHFPFGGFEEKMNRSEAANILGCREGAPKEIVLERYRTLVKINHPDLGGSPYIATKVNEAKDMLLGHGGGNANSAETP